MLSQLTQQPLYLYTFLNIKCFLHIQAAACYMSNDHPMKAAMLEMLRILPAGNLESLGPPTDC